MSLPLFLAFLCCVLALPTTIPYYTGPKLSVDSGYIPVGNIKLFYLHVASEQKPESDPVVFWFQGGPGGSSMIGAFLENGPWKVTSKKSVEYKSLNWIKPGANMVFLDQPACVGFSYSTDLKDCNTSDTKAAAVNVQAIKTFLYSVMPEYKSRKFWFSGESYAGAYVPMLSALVVDDPDLSPNFAGFMVGNPVMECYDPRDPQDFGVGDTWSYFNQLYWNGYVDQEDYEKWRREGCDSESHRHGVPHPRCDDILNSVSGAKNLGTDFDPDNNFADYCTGNGTLDFATSECSDDSGSLWSVMTDYLSLPEVSTAFHADIIFNSRSNYFNYTADARGMLKYYEHVLAAKPSVKILVYSGLSDVYTVPFTYTMPCIYQLGRATRASVKVPWKLWHPPTKVHHGGHWQQWSNNVTYATVRAAGHEVPMYQPYLAMVMFDRFLHTYGLGD